MTAFLRRKTTIEEMPTAVCIVWIRKGVRNDRAKHANRKREREKRDGRRRNRTHLQNPKKTGTAIL